MTELANSQNYLDFFITVKERIRKSQYDALKAVNKELILLYYDIVKLITNEQLIITNEQLRITMHCLVIRN